jgi:chemotaxis protein CheZ
LESGDSPELEALFDSIAKQHGDDSAAPQEPAATQAAEADPSVDLAAMAAGIAGLGSMYDQIGQLTRKLHDTLHDLGYDKSLEVVAEAIPDAKDRLTYIARLAENAADRVLNATDVAKPLQDELEDKSKQLASRWDKLYANQLSLEEFKALAAETRAYLNYVPTQTQATNGQLMEIVMAQDFQDLTGQVIKKIMVMVQTLESELLSFLIKFSPEEKKTDLAPDLLQGPVVNAEGREDVVTSQQQVDDLLASLGF